MRTERIQSYDMSNENTKVNLVSFFSHHAEKHCMQQGTHSLYVIPVTCNAYGLKQ